MRLPQRSVQFKSTHHFFVSSYQQAQSAVAIGLRKLEELGVPVKRPDDYFAEMVKTDDHMRKVHGSIYTYWVSYGKGRISLTEAPPPPPPLNFRQDYH